MFNCKGYGGRGRLRWDSCSKGSRERDPLEPLLSRQRRLTRTRDGAVENQRPTPRFHDSMSSAVAKALVPKVRRDGTDLQEMTPVTGVLVESIQSHLLPSGQRPHLLPPPLWKCIHALLLFSIGRPATWHHICTCASYRAFADRPSASMLCTGQLQKQTTQGQLPIHPVLPLVTKTRSHFDQMVGPRCSAEMGIRRK